MFDREDGLRGTSGVTPAAVFRGEVRLLRGPGSVRRRREAFEVTVPGSGLGGLDPAGGFVGAGADTGHDANCSGVRNWSCRPGLSDEDLSDDLGEAGMLSSMSRADRKAPSTRRSAPREARCPWCARRSGQTGNGAIGGEPLPSVGLKGWPARLLESARFVQMGLNPYLDLLSLDAFHAIAVTFPRTIRGKFRSREPNSYRRAGRLGCRLRFRTGSNATIADMFLSAV